MASSDAPLVVAGATGFVGRALLAALPRGQPVRALSRRGGDDDQGPVRRVRCDLFNLLQAERALAGCRTAVYLVHSMSPNARLAQGDFWDMDLICADNFARAARAAGVEHIVYLGGLIPAERPLSRHLASRLEVEQALASHGVPVTTLRAGLVIGAGGSSFAMMARLVQRLPAMVVPRWTASKTQPIALEDTVALLSYAIAQGPGLAGTFDIGCDDVLTYAEMLRATRRLLGGRRLRIMSLPVRSVRLSLVWVSLVTQTPVQLVAPLVESLRHDMVTADGRQLQARCGQRPLGFAEAVRRAANASAGRPPPPMAPPRRRRGDPSRVLSVQRLPVPEDADAPWLADEYARWLPRFLRPLVRVEVDAGRVFRFFLPILPWPLLVLTFAAGRSNPGRQLFYITDGALVRGLQPEPGRFEFRLVLGRTVCLTTVYDFVPRLPWLVYKASQAVVHRLIMAAFGRHLRRRRRPPGSRAPP